MSTAAVVHFPKVPLAAAIGLVVLVVLGVGAFRLSGAPTSPGIGSAETLAARDISFTQMTDGTLEVRDADTGALLRRTPPGGASFLHGSIRGLMYGRKLEGVPLSAPFHLEARGDGQVVLTDPSLGAQMALNAFGHGNALEFKSLLQEEGRTQ